jgi:transcriptional regulator with XRE-family HTH domain
VSKRDLDIFHKLNAAEKEAGQKMEWEDRYVVIKQEFPSAERLNWAEALRDVEVLGKVIRDILKDTLAEEGTTGPGPRPPLPMKEGSNRLRQLEGEDYSDYEFPEAFYILAQGRSVRHLARKLNMNSTLVYNLLKAKKHPDMATMEMIAKTFEKRPSYFLEYRVGYIVGALADKLVKTPDITIPIYAKLKGNR